MKCPPPPASCPGSARRPHAGLYPSLHQPAGSEYTTSFSYGRPHCPTELSDVGPISHTCVLLLMDNTGLMYYIFHIWAPPLSDLVPVRSMFKFSQPASRAPTAHRDPRRRHSHLTLRPRLAAQYEPPVSARPLPRVRSARPAPQCVHRASALTSVTGIRYRQKASTSDVGVVTGTSTGSTLASPRTETLASSSPIPNRCVRAIPRLTAPLAHQPWRLTGSVLVSYRQIGSIPCKILYYYYSTPLLL